MGDRLDEGRARVAARSALRASAAALAIVYLGWNAFWLGQGRVPPALWLGLTGLPAPTTGGMRSLAALLDGDWRASLRLNACAVPMALLFAYCVAGAAWSLLRRGRPALPAWTARAWLALLAVAWGTKLAG